MTERPFGIIYRVTNKVNGKSYIGQTTLTLAQRWACHVTNREKAPLARAIRKYGREAFTLDALCECDSREMLDAAEVEWITRAGTKVPKGYNLKDGGNAGVPLTDEIRARMSALLCERYADPVRRAAHAEQMRAIWNRPETRAKASESHKRRCADPVERERMRNLALMHWSDPAARERESIAAQARWTPERRAAFAAAVKASWQRPEVRAQREASLAKTRYRIAVIATKDGTDQTFASSREAAAALGVSEAGISDCLHGKRKHTGGYTFRRK
jgi:group I intron endonuclease